MSRVRCLSCDAENDAVQSAGYCERCGKKLPPASLAHQRRDPAVFERPAAMATPVERTPPQPASGWLFTAALVNLLGCGGIVVLGPLLLPRESIKADFIPDQLLVGVVVLLAYAGLGWWARRQPMLAAVAAIVVYLALAGVEALATPGLGLVALPVKVVILALLIQAVRVSRKPRRLAAEP